MNRISAFICVIFAALSPLASTAAPERTSTVQERQSVNLTIYNGGTALVHDRRRVPLTAGLNRVAWRDVSANMDATSALLRSVGGAGSVDVLEQNFDYDLLNPSALLERYVGRTVVVVHDPRVAGERETRETARLLSTNGGIVLQYKDRIETDVRGHIIFPSASKTFRDKPTLVLDMNSARGGVQTLDLSYLTSGLSWRADYVGVLSPDETHLALTGLVTLSNNSGIGYENARLQLVAGNVNVAAAPMGMAEGSLKTIAAVRSRSSFAQQNYFEYHLYTLQRPTTIQNNQTKQISLLNANGVPVVKTLELRGSSYYYQSSQSDLGDRLQAGVYVTFQNRGGDLGIPLPAGIIRLYKNDSGSISQFVGSDSIDHTPKNDTVRLHLGDSFDVTGRKRQTDFRFTSSCSSESSYEDVISNAKSIAQDVLVVESIPGEWHIAAENTPHRKSSASTATWTVHVPADSSTTLTYTAISSWCYEGS